MTYDELQENYDWKEVFKYAEGQYLARADFEKEASLAPCKIYNVAEIVATSDGERDERPDNHGERPEPLHDGERRRRRRGRRGGRRNRLERNGNDLHGNDRGAPVPEHVENRCGRAHRRPTPCPSIPRPSGRTRVVRHPVLDP